MVSHKINLKAVLIHASNAIAWELIKRGKGSKSQEKVHKKLFAYLIFLPFEGLRGCSIFSGLGFSFSFVLSSWTETLNSEATFVTQFGFSSVREIFFGRRPRDAWRFCNRSSPVNNEPERVEYYFLILYKTRWNFLPW